PDACYSAGSHARKQKGLDERNPYMLKALYQSSPGARHFRMSSAGIRRRSGASSLCVVPALRRGRPSERLAIPRIALSPQATILAIAVYPRRHLWVRQPPPAHILSATHGPTRCLAPAVYKSLTKTLHSGYSRAT